MALIPGAGTIELCCRSELRTACGVHQKLNKQAGKRQKNRKSVQQASRTWPLMVNGTELTASTQPAVWEQTGSARSILNLHNCLNKNTILVRTRGLLWVCLEGETFNLCPFGFPSI